MENIKTLFIDDDEVHNFIIRSHLKRVDLSIEPLFLKNGEEAFNYLLETPSEDWPKVVVVDLKMPLMDGFEFLKRVNKKYPLIHSDICFVVLTASISPHDREETMKYHFVRNYLVKPIDEITLSHQFSACLQKHLVRPRPR